MACSANNELVVEYDDAACSSSMGENGRPCALSLLSFFLRPLPNIIKAGKGNIFSFLALLSIDTAQLARKAPGLRTNEDGMEAEEDCQQVSPAEKILAAIGRAKLKPTFGNKTGRVKPTHCN